MRIHSGIRRGLILAILLVPSAVRGAIDVWFPVVHVSRGRTEISGGGYVDEAWESTVYVFNGSDTARALTFVESFPYGAAASCMVPPSRLLEPKQSVALQPGCIASGP